MDVKRDYLRAMGIEIWSIRPPVPERVVAESVGQPSADHQQAPRTVLPAASPTAAQIVAPLRTGQPSGVGSSDHALSLDGSRNIGSRNIDGNIGGHTGGAEKPVFSLVFLHYRTHGFCLWLNSADSALSRKFCDDVARFIGADLTATKYQKLDWPMLNTPGVDQSLEVVQEVLAQKFSVLPKQIIVFGEEVCRFHPGLVGTSLGETRILGSQSVLLVPALKTLLDSGSQKRQLLQWLVGRGHS